jgi:membrane-bound lytic murein transglycosylase MltF
MGALPGPAAGSRNRVTSLSLLDPEPATLNSIVSSFNAPFSLPRREYTPGSARTILSEGEAMRTLILTCVTVAVLALSFAPGCSRSPDAPLPTLAGDEPYSIFDSDDSQFAEVLRRTLEPWTGDLDGMAERRFVRALVTPNRTQYFLDGAEQKGTAFELLKQLETELNKELGTRTVKFHVVIIPTSRDRLIPDLVEGRGDIAATNLTITPERREKVDFADPLISVDEIVVTGTGTPELTSLEDLSGKKVHVRRSSSYWSSLEALNQEFAENGLKKIRVEEVDELLETEDVLEMVNAGLIDITIADSFLAEFWSQIFENISLYTDLTVRQGGEIAWAFRKDSPKLEAALNRFMKKRKKGTLLGNILIKRYFESTDWVEDPSGREEMERFEEAVQYFQKYGEEYGFEYLMIAAQAYQESRIDQSVRSRAGAIGVMQLLKSTASDPNVNIPEIEDLERNIHAGVKYLRFLTDRYFDEEGIDRLNRGLFALAAYNAGPSRISKLRGKAADNGLDPNRWFGNVEVIAAREIGRETVQYVSNIYKYYLAYSLIVDQETRKAKAKG